MIDGPMLGTADDAPGVAGRSGPLNPMRWRSGFTLVEVMLSMAVLAIMLLLIANIIGTTQRSWRSASARLSQFREARIAFDTLARNLRQATLNTYRAYRYNNAADPLVPAVESVAVAPEGYIRASELAFRCGQASALVGNLGSIGQPVGHAVFFQAPLGVTDETRYENLKNLLCVRGYFVVDGDDSAFLPSGLSSKLTPTPRLRLMEYQPPAENNRIYAESANSDDWIDVGKQAGSVNYLRPVSENIAALIISPRLSAGDDPVPFAGATARPTSIAPNYTYDSTKIANVTTSDTQGSQHILPPVIKLAMIALDGTSLGSPGASEAIDAIKGAQFNNADNYANDLKQVEDTLNRARVNYRIFETSVVIPASKWTL